MFKEGIYIKGKQVKIYAKQEHKHIVFDGTKAKYINNAAKLFAKAMNGGVIPYAIKEMTGDYFIEKELGKASLLSASDPSKFYVDEVYKKIKSKLTKNEEVTASFAKALIKENLIPGKQ